MLPSCDLNKIKFSTDEATFQRAVGLYESGKVTKVEALGTYLHAIVMGTEPYNVSVSIRNYKQGSCTCYLGQKDTLCKHMVALALHAVLNGRPLSDEEREVNNEVKLGSRREELTPEELAEVKKSITENMKYIKPYSGPSRTWFANQDSLREGCNRLAAVVSALPVNKQSAAVLANLLLRLDRKLSVGGVDDSNGIVGGFMSQVVGLLEEFAQLDPGCIDEFEPLVGIETCFEWNEPLAFIWDERAAEEYSRQVEKRKSARTKRKTLNS